MSSFKLIHGSCLDIDADVIVNAANGDMFHSGGIAAAIRYLAGSELDKACSEYDLPIKDGRVIITPSFNLNKYEAIIHAVGPDFRRNLYAIKELYEAYYNSLILLKDNNYHSISFPLISASIFAGNKRDAVEESTKQCMRAYNNFISEYPDYDIDVFLSAYKDSEYERASSVI